MAAVVPQPASLLRFKSEAIASRLTVCSDGGIVQERAVTEGNKGYKMKQSGTDGYKKREQAIEQAEKAGTSRINLDQLRTGWNKLQQAIGQVG